ncbi:ABC transporter ATP-binding protein/permease, partial [Bacteroidales bacterium OttesenSCG-928-B11]|nr:ABC transporter ATP-binding protein/permease [Bacteroidales bacterium OttesenSCG-928-B11]
MKEKEQNKKKGLSRENLRILKRLFGYLAKERKLLIVVTILILVSTVCHVFSSYLLRPIINDAIIPGNISKLITLLVTLAIVYFAGTFSVWLQYRVLNNTGQRTVARLRKDLFDKMEKLPLRYFDKHQTGDLMSRYTNDMDRVSEVLTETLSDMFTNILTLFATVAIMLFISPILTLTTVLIVPLMIWVASMVVKRSRIYFKEQQRVMGETNGYVEEIISGQKVVKLFSHEQKAEADFDVHNKELRQKAEKAQLFSGLMMPLMQNMNTLNFVFVTIVGGLLTIFRGFDLGGLAAFLQYSRQFGRPINELSAQYNTLQGAIAGAERIFRIIDETPEDIHDTPNPTLLDTPPKGMVKFENVSFEYEKDVPVLKDISFEAFPGKKIALVGSTGAGKTTIFNILPRFYDIQQGNIFVDGIPQHNITRTQLRQSMVLVLQDVHLFNDTVRENIRYGRLDATDAEVEAAAKLAAAHNFITRLPHGYDTKLSDDGANLSQGQRQLLSIARAAVANPPVILLDEATSDVDTETEKLIQQGMDQLMRDRTTLVIAHRISTIMNADEILVIEHGQIIERGNHETLAGQKGRYWE